MKVLHDFLASESIRRSDEERGGIKAVHYVQGF